MEVPVRDHCNLIVALNQTFFPKKFFGGQHQKSKTGISVASQKGLMSPWVSKPGWIPCMLSHLCDPQIHLWCNTCRLYRGQHSSWVFSIHILADVSTSIGGGSGFEPTSEHSAVYYLATLGRLNACFPIIGAHYEQSSEAWSEKGKNSAWHLIKYQISSLLFTARFILTFIAVWLQVLYLCNFEEWLGLEPWNRLNLSTWLQVGRLFDLCYYFFTYS